MSACGAEIHKFAMMVNAAMDLCPIFSFLQMSVYPTIAIAMEKFGQGSRIVSRKFGAYLTFASVNEGQESSPGQLSTSQLTKQLGLMGYLFFFP